MPHASPSPSSGRATTMRQSMAAIAWRLPDDRHDHAEERAAQPAGEKRSIVELRVVLLAISLGLVSFAYGALTSFSAMFADDLGVTPRSLFLTMMACSIVAYGRA